jgi:hypothetical protein
MKIIKVKSSISKQGYRLELADPEYFVQTLKTYFGNDWIKVFKKYCFKDGKVKKKIWVTKKPNNDFEEFLLQCFGVHGVNYVGLSLKSFLNNL